LTKNTSFIAGHEGYRGLEERQQVPRQLINQTPRSRVKTNRIVELFYKLKTDVLVGKKKLAKKRLKSIDWSIDQYTHKRMESVEWGHILTQATQNVAQNGTNAFTSRVSFLHS
jgi:ribosomal protein S20